MGASYSQIIPPKPTLTEANLSSQEGKVFVVTGGYSGCGFHLSRILYLKGGKVYIAGRSEAKARGAIEKIRSSVGTTTSSLAQLEFLHIELDDLSSVKTAAEKFKAQEPKLHVLWNNAGVALPPEGSKTTQGHDLQIGTNCLGHHLFTQLLLPCLKAAARDTPPASVRVVWTASLVVDFSAPAEGIPMADLDRPPNDKAKMYCHSKTGNWFLAAELARTVGPSDGILSVVQNPGSLKTDLLRHARWMSYAAYPLLYEACMGAYTELWAGLSPELGMGENGAYVVPWGRVHPAPREDLLQAIRRTEDGGTGRAKEFWDWCEGHTAQYR